MSEKTMLAVRAHERGGPEQLVVEEAARPSAGPGEVLVAVRAAAVTFDELTWTETWEADGADRTPIIPSHEFSGVIAEVGAGVTDLAPGDPVFGLVPFDRDGAAAEYVVVPAESVARRDPRIPDTVAAAAVLPALTAWEALRDEAQVGAGSRVLVRGATGAVGAFLIQFARRMGAEVTATVRSTGAEERVRSLGASRVVIADGETAPTDLSGFDVVADAVGDEAPEWFYAAARPGGLLIVLQTPPDDALAGKYGIRTSFFVVRTRRDRLTELSDLLANGDIEVAIARTVPLADGASAYRREGAGAGKTVITVDPSA